MAGGSGWRRGYRFIRKMIRNKYVLFVFRVIVGGIFIWAGLLKIVDPLDFAQSISNYRAFSQGLSFFLAVFLPWIEVICGVFLILGIFPRASSLLLSSLLVAFLILIAATIMRGIDIDCGCFGRFSQKVSFRLIIEDILLFYLSLNILFSKADQPVLLFRQKN